MPIPLTPMKNLRLITVFLLFAVIGCAQKPDETDNETEYVKLWFGYTTYSEEIQAVAYERMKKIRAEIKSLGDHPWAGEYHELPSGGMEPSRMFLAAPKSGFLYTCQHCTGMYDLNYGDITREQDTLHFTFMLPREKKDMVFEDKEYVPASWQGVCYLIPPGDVIDFCVSPKESRQWRRMSTEDLYEEMRHPKKKTSELPIPPEQFKLDVQKRQTV